MTVPEKPLPVAAVEAAQSTESGPQTLTVSVGPQHSGSGHMRLIVELDGDVIVKVAPDPGYVHRGIEKICEVRNIIHHRLFQLKPCLHPGHRRTTGC